jgi:hypothetical protein
MNALELKGAILENISNVQEVSVLEEIHQMIVAYLAQKEGNDDFWQELNPVQQQHMLWAMEQAKSKDNGLMQDEAFQQTEKWLA